MKITTPEIICDVFSFLHKSQIERVQLVNQFWNSVIIRHKNIWPLRQFVFLDFIYNQIDLYATEQDEIERLGSYKIKFDGTNLSKVEENVSSWYQAKKLTSQLTVDEVLTNLNDVVFDSIRIRDILEGSLDDLVNLIKLVTTKTGGRFRGRFGQCDATILDSRLVEIFGKEFLNTQDIDPPELNILVPRAEP